MTKSYTAIAFALSASTLALAAAGQAAAADRPWTNASMSADARATMVLKQLTRDEKLSLVLGYFATEDKGRNYHPPQAAREGSAGFVPGIARLGIPPQWQ